MEIELAQVLKFVCWPAPGKAHLPRLIVMNDFFFTLFSCGHSVWSVAAVEGKGKANLLVETKENN